MRTPAMTNVERAAAARRAGYRVRRLETADVQRAAEVHVQVWREAYAELMPADYLSGLDPRRLAQRRLEHLSSPQSYEVVDLVGLNPGGEIVAMAVAGPERDDDAPTVWELWAINVLASEHGTGLADLLMRDVVGKERPTCGYCATTSGRWRSIGDTVFGRTVLPKTTRLPACSRSG